MKSKESYFSFSSAIIRENIRRFWAVAVLSFCFYFLSGIFPILMAYRNLNNLAGYIETCLAGMQPFFFVANFMTPVITAILVFKYLQSVNSTTYMNALPLSRAKLYNSNVLSGFLLAVAPMLLAGLIMLIIAKPVYYDYMPVVQNVFARVEILGWMLDSFVIILFVYAVSILAGMVTSNSIIHLCIALFFNFLIPALYGAMVLYSDYFLAGYTTRSEIADLWVNFTPVIKIFTGTVGGAVHTVCYILIALALIVLSSLCYHKRKMENAGNSIAFGFMVPVISYLVTFFGMSLTGAYFHTLGGDLYMYFGFAVGAILFFLVGMMILLRTPKVFTKKSLKSFVVYSIISTLFVSCFAFDLTGFEKRVPHTDKVEYAQINTDFFTVNSWDDRYQTRYYTKVGENGTYKDVVFKENENISAIIALHNDIVQNLNSVALGASIRESPYFLPSNSLLLRYNTGSLTDMTRQYNVSTRYIMESPYAKQLFESKEFKEFFSFNNLRYVKITSMELSSDGIDIVNFKDLGLGASDMAALLDAMEKDFQNRTFEEHMDPTHPVARMGMQFLSIDNLDRQGNPVQEYMNAEILACDTNTISWLTKIGYMADLAAADASVSKIIVTQYDRKDRTMGETPTVAAKFLGTQSSGTVIAEDSVIITDQSEMAKILSTYQSTNFDPTNYYMVEIYYPAYQSTIFHENDKYYENSYEYSQKYSDNEDYSISTGYYDSDTVPDFIKAKFKNENQ